LNQIYASEAYRNHHSSHQHAKNYENTTVSPVFTILSDSNLSNTVNPKNDEIKSGSQLSIQEKSKLHNDEYLETHADKNDFQTNLFSAPLGESQSHLIFSRESLERARATIISPVKSYDYKVSNVPSYASDLKLIGSLKPESLINEPGRSVLPVAVIEDDVVPDDSTRLEDLAGSLLNITTDFPINVVSSGIKAQISTGWQPSKDSDIVLANDIQMDVSNQLESGARAISINGSEKSPVNVNHDDQNVNNAGANTYTSHTSGLRRASEAVVKPSNKRFDQTQRATTFSSPSRSNDRRVSMVPLFGSDMKLLGTIKESQKSPTQELNQVLPIGIANNDDGAEINRIFNTSTTDSNVQKNNYSSHATIKTTVLTFSANN